MWSFLASSSGVGSRPSSPNICRVVRAILLAASVMCTGIRIVRDWSDSERLTDCRIHHMAYVPNLAAAVVECGDGPHQADIAFLNSSEELQAAVIVSLGDGNHEPQIGLHHLLLRLACFVLALPYHLHVSAELADLETYCGGELVDLRSQ